VPALSTEAIGRRWLLAGAMTARFAAATYLLLADRGATTRAASVRSLAVLPLRNLSADPDQEFFADGMTEALIGRLSSIRGIRVISRTSAMHFKGTRLPLPEIARRFTSTPSSRVGRAPAAVADQRIAHQGCDR
jgi:hypothetical protein